MNWLLLTILAITSRAIYSIATKLLSSQVKVSSITQSVLLTSFATILTLLVSPFIGGISFRGIPHIWLTTLLMVFSQAIGNVLFFKGLERLDAGNSQIAFSSILVWGAILSVLFLHSTFSWLQLLGILLLLFAIILIQYRKGRERFNISVGYIIAAAGLFAVFQVTSAQLSTVMNAGTYLFLAYFGSAVIISLIYAKRVLKDMQLLTKQVAVVGRNGLFASGTSLLYFLFSYFAYRLASDRGIVVVLLTTQVILSVIFGIVFLKERESIKQKLIAGTIALVASVLIKV